MTDYFCQNNLKVVEDRRCSYLKSYNGYLRKSSLLPIKAPGNLCRTPFSWASGNFNSVLFVNQLIEGMMTARNQKLTLAEKLTWKGELK